MNIENPFIFGRAAEGTYFTDREEDAKRLVKGAVLISPKESPVFLRLKSGLCIYLNIRKIQKHRKNLSFYEFY